MAFQLTRPTSRAAIPDLTASELFCCYRDEGNLSAFSELCNRLRPKLMRVATRLTRDPGTAEDAIQDAFMVSIERAASYDASRPFEPWLLGILTKAIRRLHAGRTLGLSEEATPDPLRTEDDVQLREVVHHLERALLELPPAYREVLLLCVREGLTPQEVGRLLGRSTSTVRTQLERGRRKIRELVPRGLSLSAVFVRLPRSEEAAMAELKARVLRLAGRRHWLPTATVVLAVATVTLGVAVWWGGDRPSGDPPSEQLSSAAGVAAVDGPMRAAEPQPGRPASSEIVPPEPAAEPGLETPAASIRREGLLVRTFEPDGVTPLPHVMFMLRVRGSRGSPESMLTTDDQGQFELRSGKVDIAEIFVPGLMGTPEAKILRTFHEEASRVIDILGPVGRRVRIRAVDSEGQPVSGARVDLGFARDSLGRMGRTDVQGEYLVNQAPRVLYVTVEDEGNGGSHLHRILPEPGGEEIVDVIVHPGEGRLKVTAEWEVNAMPRLWLIVSLVPTGVNNAAFPPRTYTGFTTEGLEISGLPVGRFKATVAVHGRLGETREIELVARETVEFKHISRAGATLQGQVMDLEGNPLAGMLIGDVSGIPDSSGLTDHEGRYLIKGLPPGSHDFFVSDAKRRQVLSANFRLAEGDVIDWSPRLGEPRVLEGRLFDEAGPVAGGLINCSFSLGQTGGVMGLNVVTDEHGRFRISSLPVSHVRVDARRSVDESAPGLVIPVVALDGGPLELRMGPPRPRVSVEVRGATAGNEVYLVALPFQSSFIGIEPDGVFRAPSILPGEYAIRDGRSGDWLGPVTVGDGPGPVVFEVASLPWLEDSHWAIYESPREAFTALDRRESRLGPLPPSGVLLECGAATPSAGR